jgi:hypothetical protein
MTRRGLEDLKRRRDNTEQVLVALENGPSADGSWDAVLCPKGLMACFIPETSGTKWECIDANNDVDSGGGERKKFKRRKEPVPDSRFIFYAQDEWDLKAKVWYALLLPAPRKSPIRMDHKSTVNLYLPTHFRHIFLTGEFHFVLCVFVCLRKNWTLGPCSR